MPSPHLLIVQSKRHVAFDVSAFSRPSSHCSPGSTFPFPQICAKVMFLQLWSTHRPKGHSVSFLQPNTQLPLLQYSLVGHSLSALQPAMHVLFLQINPEEH